MTSAIARARLVAVTVAALLAAACGGKDRERTVHREVQPDDGTLLDRDGSLDDGDLRMGRAFADHYEVAVAQGDRIVIELTSNAFDPLLEAVPPDGQALVNDDWEGDRTRSRIELVPDRDGVLKLRVTSYAPGSTGAYHVRVARSPAPAPSSIAAEAEAVARLGAGESLQGRITSGDAALADGTRYDRLTVEVGADEPLALAVGSVEGPAPRVEVVDPEGRALRAEGGSFSLVAPGLYRVLVAAPSADVELAYRAEATRSEQGATPPQPQLARSHHQPTTTGAATRAELDRRVQGELAEGDVTLPSGELADVYELAGTAGMQVAFEMASDEVDSYLVVLGPDGQYWENDDANGSLSSALTVPLPADGTYRIFATTYRPGETGSYELKVFRDQRGAAATAAATTAPPTPPAPPPQPAPATGDTQTRQGELASGDSQLQSGEFFDSYTYTWRAGQTVRLRATSDDIDTYLIVRTPSGRQSDNDDGPDGTTNSFLELRVVESGDYQVLVTSYSPGETGAYELAVEGGGGATAPPTPGPPPTPVATGGNAQRTTGTLALGDQQLRSGEFYDTHELELPVGRPVRIEARSTQFDTYLILQDPTGEQQDNDDQNPGNVNAAIELVTPVAGTYRVLVTSYRPGEQGAYELLVTGAGEAQPPDGGDDAPPAVAVEAGREVAGELAEGDRQLDSGEYVDSHTLRFGARQSVRLRLASDAFDTYLVVRTPSGRQIDNDDFESGSLSSGVDLPRTEDGDYTVLVTSYAPGETGPYVLRVESGAAVPGPAVTGGGGGGSGGHVYAVLAGITDYPAPVSNLPECANDAIKLGETLREQGLLTEDRQVLLTDAQATRANVRAAMTQMAERVGPNDTFIFFYSGHGGRNEHTPSSDARELDRADEFLVMHDGPLLDDELGQLFDGIGARLAVVALDACFAGGFAKDVITRPGRVGLFSSEEDVTSAVAGAFEAGGYLSHFLRTGIAGDADTAPRDSVLTVGELTHYLTLQFGSHVTNVRMSEGFQHLVVDRGAVGHHDVMWAYR